MFLKAHAKLNLALKVVSKRDDGYHDIESLFLPLELHDCIEIKIDKNGYDDFVTCDDFTLKKSRYNVCHKIINAARDKWGFKDKLVINIHKNIFLQAGLGGGSADAAATLLGIVKLFKIKTTMEELIDLSIKLGSDIPWSLYSVPAIVLKKGEIVNPVKLKKQYWVLIVKPQEGLPTVDVFNKYDELNDPTTDKSLDYDKMVDCLNSGDLKTLDTLAFNDLEKPASVILPLVSQIKDELKQKGFEFVRMSGAGSSIFALTTDEKKAIKAYEYFETKNCNIELTKTLIN